jgi:hypothetical protein
VLQHYDGLIKARTKLFEKSEDRINSQIKALSAESAANDKLVNIEKYYPNVMEALQNSAQFVENNALTVPTDKKPDQFLIGYRQQLQKLIGLARGKKILPDETEKAIALRLARVARSEGGDHLVGYGWIKRTTFNGQDPDVWMESKYPVRTTEEITKMAEQEASPDLAFINQKIRAAELFVHQEFGFPISDDNGIDPSGLAAAKAGQKGELDQLMGEVVERRKEAILRKLLLGGAGAQAAVNPAQGLLNSMLTMPPTLGPNPRGAGRRLMRAAYRLERQSKLLERDRIAFERDFGYAPGGTRVRRAEAPTRVGGLPPAPSSAKLTVPPISARVPAGAPTPEEVVAAPAAAAPAAAATPAEPIDVQQALKTLRENRRDLAVYSGDAGNFLKYMQNSYQGMSGLSGGDERAKVFANAIRLDVYDNLLNLPPAYATNIASALGYKNAGAMFNGALDSEDIIAKVDRAINDPETVGLGDLSTVYYDLTKDLSFLSDPDDVLAAKQRLGQIKAAIDAIPPEIRGNIGREIDAAYRQFAGSDEDDITKINQLFGRLIGAGEDALEVSPTSDAAEMMRERERYGSDEGWRERDIASIPVRQKRIVDLSAQLKAAQAKETDIASQVGDLTGRANQLLKKMQDLPTARRMDPEIIGHPTSQIVETTLRDLRSKMEAGPEAEKAGLASRIESIEKMYPPGRIDETDAYKALYGEYKGILARQQQLETQDRSGIQAKIKRLEQQIVDQKQELSIDKAVEARGGADVAPGEPILSPPDFEGRAPFFTQFVDEPTAAPEPKPKRAAARPPAAAPAPTPTPGVVPNLPAMISTLEDFIKDPPPGMADTDVKQAKDDLVDLKQQLYEAG